VVKFQLKLRKWDDVVVKPMGAVSVFTNGGVCSICRRGVEEPAPVVLDFEQ